MSDHLIAEAHRHAMALPTTHPTHADIAWYVREVSGLRAELALLREWQREVIQNANAHHAERKDAIARAESAEREAFDWKKIARYEAARAERAEAELALTRDKPVSGDCVDEITLIKAELAKERALFEWVESNVHALHHGLDCKVCVRGEDGMEFSAETWRSAAVAAMKEAAS